MTATETKARETDTALAAHHEELAKLAQRQSATLSRLHYGVGDTRTLHGWTRDNKSAREWAELLIGQGEDKPWIDLAGVLAKLDETERDMDVTREHIAELDAVYRADPWTRYFPCTNRDGHIHRSLACSTLRPTTQMAWTPGLSGKPVEDAVAELGEALCSVCFPAAPVAWTAKNLGQVKDERTAAERQAAKDARDAVKAAKSLTEEQQFRNHMGDRVTTVAAAKQTLRDEVELRFYYGRGPHPWHAEAVEAARKAREVLLARGVEAAELDKIVASAEKKHSKYAKA